MMRYLKLLFMSMIVVGLMAGSAFAGRTGVNSGALNTPYTASLEAVGAARNVTIQGGADNGPITYAVTQSITQQNFIGVSFTGAAFPGTSIRVCKKDAAAGNQVAIATPSSGSTSFFFQMGPTAALNAGDIVFFTTDAACNTFGIGSNLETQLSATTGSTSPSVTISIVSAGNIPVDPASTATLAQIRSEFSTAFVAGAHVVDYLGTPGNGTRFTVAPTGANNLWAGTFAAGNIIRTANNFAATNGTAAAGADNAGLTVRAVVGLTDTVSWQGVSKVFLNTLAAINCNDSAGSNAVGTGTPSGTLSLALPAGSFNGMIAPAPGGIPVNICISGNGTSALQPRTIQMNIDVNVTGTGSNDPAASAFANADVWTLNAYQAWIPWVVNASSLPTYCLFNNADASRTGSVILDVVSSETGATITNQNIGTIAPKTSGLAIFTADEVSFGGANTSISSLGANTRYAPRVTITVAPNNASINCNQTDPGTGGKRAVPALEGSGSVWKQ